MRKLFSLAFLLLLAAAQPWSAARADDGVITVASTTSTQDSGLFEHILPLFTEASGILVHVVAVGTGQAIKLAENGDADVLFVHAKAAEQKFVAEGYGVERYDVMYNDFVLVGPKSDPARIAGGKDAVAALTTIADTQSTFFSRGDDSGTNKAELRLWKDAKIDVKAASGTWYRETGSGMGATLNTAAAAPGYTLTDRATWIAFENKGELEIVVEGDERLFNQYGVTLVNPDKFSHVQAESGEIFIDWLLSKEGQAAIAGYKKNGQQLFFPNATALD